MRISKTISVAILSTVGFTNVSHGAICEEIGNYPDSCIDHPTIASDPVSIDELSTLTPRFKIYSIIKTCSENNIIFNKKNVDAAWRFINRTISETDSDTSWDVSQKMIDNRLTWDSCKEIEDNIFLFPVDIFKDAGEKNPF